jgi:LAO/AO transport system kinase
MPGSVALPSRFMAGDPRALARALTWVEAGDPRGGALLATVRARAGAGRLIGLTGAPGAGKSTLVDRLIEAWRTRGATVAVLAIDPSSPFSGGALLGDRVRMTRWAHDPGVFVRSMASRGRPGGLAPAALDAAALLAAFGFDLVVIETVGVGQAEVDVAAVADTTVVALAPGQGDDVQTAKAGLMEVADVFAITKADRPDAGRLAREVRDAVGLGEGGPWRPPVVLVAAGAAPTTHPGGVAGDGGMAALVAAIDAHGAHLAAADPEARAFARARSDVVARAQGRLAAALARMPPEAWQRVARGATSPDAVAVEVLSGAAAVDQGGLPVAPYAAAEDVDVARDGGVAEPGGC